MLDIVSSVVQVLLYFIVYSPIITFNLPDVGEAIMTVIVKEW